MDDRRKIQNEIKPAIWQHPWNVETLRQFRTVSRLSSGLIIIENTREREREREESWSFADRRNDACMQACGETDAMYIYITRNWVLIRRMAELAAFIHEKIAVVVSLLYRK